jgi:flagellar biosynthesis/type III secretory pathway M-ring protein FliF/YscJ
LSAGNATLLLVDDKREDAEEMCATVMGEELCRQPRLLRDRCVYFMYIVVLYFIYIVIIYIVYWNPYGVRFRLATRRRVIEDLEEEEEAEAEEEEEEEEEEGVFAIKSNSQEPSFKGMHI